MQLAIIFGLLMVTIVLGVPIAFAIGVASLIYLLFQGGLPIQVMPSLVYSGINSFPLLAIPFFMLAGELMNEGGLTEVLVGFARSAVGHIRGGMAHISILASMLFAGVSGSAAADTAAIGSLMIPAMRDAGYDDDFAVAVVASGGTIGPIIPPSILMVVYGCLANVSVGQLFLGGIIPGVLIGILLMMTAYWIAVARGYQQRGTFVWRELWRNLLKALPALLIPLVVIGGILGGLATATEAGILAVVVALLLGIFYFKSIRSLKQLRRIFVNAAQTSAIIFMILGTSAIFSNLLVRAQFQGLVVSTLHQLASTPTQEFLLIMLFIFILGYFVDTTAMLVMFSAPLAKVAMDLHINPIHFGVALVVVSLIGAITPPVSGLLFVACSVANIPLSRVLKVIWPFVFAMVAASILVVLMPWTVTWIPSLLYK